MTTEWAPLEPMQSESTNHADLFVGDIFGDELLDMYNSEEVSGSTEHDGVAQLSNDLPQLLDSVDNAENVPSKHNINVGCDGLQDFQSSTSMNDFTAILEEGNTPNKLDNMLVSKDGNVVQQTQSKPEAMTVANVNVNNNTSSSSPLSGKKRPAATPQVNQVMKKKVVAKACNKAVNNKGNVAVPTVTTVRRVGTIKTDIQNVTKGNNSTVPKVTSNTTQVTNGAVTIQQQQVPKAVVQKVTAAPVSSATIATTKASPPAMTVSVAQRPVQVSSSYQTVKTPQLVSANQSKTVKSASIPSTSSVCTVKTEESFKGVAQAAVNNLILSAGQNAARYEKGDSTFVKPVDTSTAHVAALTSNNWVAACAASISDAPPGTAEAAQAAALAAASDPAAAKAARARRASLTADERARQNRDRNREHARNTRLRKKAYVEELKRTLTELVTARDAAEIEKRHEKQRELEVREVRYRVMEEFLKLRARGSESNLLARWVAILEEGFTLTLPKTGYRDMVQSGTVLTRQVSRSSIGGGGATEPISDPTVQVLHGATECFDDASKLAAYLQSLVTAGSVIQSYSCDRKKFMMDGINAMLEWTWTGTGQENVPFIILKGCMRATFSPASNKLVCAEILFDSGSVISQTRSMLPFQDPHNNFGPGSESDPCALLDSVLSQAPSVQPVKQECSASVVSADKGEASDEECHQQHQQQIKKE